MSVCSVANCERDSTRRGFCHAHYERWRVNGDANESKPILIRPIPPEDRFWSKVNKLSGKDACWLWKGSSDPGGYGHFWFTWRRARMAHHVAWFFATGRWPDKLVLHTCDNPPCVRFKHLFEGTHQDNSDDMMRKGRGRHVSGEVHYRAKLSTEDITEIRARYASGALQRDLAGEFNTTQPTISLIVRRKNRMNG